MILASTKLKTLILDCWAIASMSAVVKVAEILHFTILSSVSAPGNGRARTLDKFVILPGPISFCFKHKEITRSNTLN